MGKKVTMIDPPSGWKYGFPKVLPEGIKDSYQWLIDNGYPEAEMKSYGEHFFIRCWEEEVEE